MPFFEEKNCVEIGPLVYVTYLPACGAEGLASGLWTLSNTKSAKSGQDPFLELMEEILNLRVWKLSLNPFLAALELLDF